MAPNAHSVSKEKIFISFFIIVSLLLTVLFTVLSVQVFQTHAADIDYIADTTIIVNGLTLKIKNGSKATRVFINAVTASFTVPAQTTFTVESETGRQLSTSSEIAQNCSDQGGTLKNSLIIEGPKTFTIDPKDVSCKIATSGRYGSGASAAIVVVAPVVQQPVAPPAAGGAPSPAQQVIVDEAKVKADQAAVAAAEATSKAEEARLAAEEARKKADEAMTAVESARVKVETATSADAKKQAEEATLAAIEALKKADEATGKADQAKKKADEVASIAALAKQKSDQASGLAAEAQKKAAEVAEFSKEAKAIADEASRTALNAKVKADLAVSTAFGAQQEVKATEKKVQETKKAAEKITEKRQGLVKKIEARIEAEAFKQELVDIKKEAKVEITVNPEMAAKAVGVERNEKMEQKFEPLVERIIEKAGVQAQALAAPAQAKLENFVTYGTKLTEDIGAGERAGVVRSYQTACGKLPETQKDWENVLRIANGRFPDAKDCIKTKDRSFTNFELVYKREPDLKNPNDSAAVNVMQFGLLPKKRSVQSEKRAIGFFKGIYGFAPNAPTAWNVVRAIAYSGARR